MTKQRKSITKSKVEYQPLESRLLLAGNVNVSVQADILQVLGDFAGNEIRITGTSDGRAQVIGLAGTTINGGSSPFVLSTPLRNIAVQTGGGDDSVTVEGIRTAGYLDVDLGFGNDVGSLRELNVRTLNVNGRGGNDVVQVRNVFAAVGYTSIQTQEGDDVLAIDSLSGNRGALMDTGEGSDVLAIDNLGLGDRLSVNTAGGGDRVFITGLVNVPAAQFSLGTGNDTLSVQPRLSSTTANFGKELSVRAGDGNDTVFFGPSTFARKSANIDGGAGNDSVGAPGAAMRRARYSAFESRSLSNVNSALDAFFESLRSANINTEPYGRVTTRPFLTMTSAPLQHYGSSGASSIDGGLVLNGVIGSSVTQATVTISGGYVAGQDVLAFTNTGAITGSFNSATGQLTLTGSASVSEYQAALRSITYDNLLTTTQEKTRRIDVQVNSSQGTFSQSRNIDLGDQLAIQAYLSDNGLTAQKTSSGLHYIIDQVGNGTRPTISDTVRVNYVGTLINGSQFDANRNITFALTNVIVGWQEGIPLFSVGGKGRLIIPSSLAYGAIERPGIPANSVLIFEIDLLGIE